MGSSESTSRSNHTEEEKKKEERKPENDISGGVATAIAVAAGAAAVAYESTSRSNHTEEEKKKEERKPENDISGGVATAIAVAAGAAAVAYGVSQMLSAYADKQNQENDGRMKMKASATTERYYISESSKNGPEAWSPPPFGRYKMNTDGGARPNPGPSGYGGILRDHHGNWVVGFRGFIGDGDGLTAEFHGILKGLQLLDRFELKHSILESDCTGAVDWIKKEDAPYLRHSDIITSCWWIITECRRLVQKNNITITHVSEDFNRCADKLATMAIINKEDYMEINELPYEFKHIVEAESPGSFSISGRPLSLS